MRQRLRHFPSQSLWQTARGFTLPEVIVVTLLISILSAQALPRLSQSWNQLLVSRLVATLHVVIQSVRQHAIVEERGTLIEFSQQTWCARYADADDDSCALAFGQLPNPWVFGLGNRTTAVFEYSPGRGFSPLSAGQIQITRATSSQPAISIFNSTLGRSRVCASFTHIKMPAC
ncbi:MAG: hypothetical protein C0463_08870 [Idiomarina sp.]|nr:hypothetical protein [Idiomarina sp.]